MGENKTSSVSKATTLEQIGDFWDQHDFTEVDDPSVPDANFQITGLVRVDSELLAQLEQQAHQRGVRLETLVNLWLQQKLSETQVA